MVNLILYKHNTSLFYFISWKRKYEGHAQNQIVKYFINFLIKYPI